MYYQLKSPEIRNKPNPDGVADWQNAAASILIMKRASKHALISFHMEFCSDYKVLLIMSKELNVMSNDRTGLLKQYGPSRALCSSETGLWLFQRIGRSSAIGRSYVGTKLWKSSLSLIIKQIKKRVVI